MNTILLFPGQGAQVVGMGKAWYDASDTVRKCFDLADKMLPFRLSDLCFNGPTEALQETRICQPALFVVGYAIFAHLKKLGFFDKNPIIATTGISLGELTALAVADVFDFETGLKMVAERGRLMQEACDKAGIDFVPGIELSTDYNGHEIHILGYCFDYADDNFNEILTKNVKARDIRTEKILSALRDNGFDITLEALYKCNPAAVITRAHIATYLYETGQLKSQKEWNG